MSKLLKSITIATAISMSGCIGSFSNSNDHEIIFKRWNKVDSITWVVNDIADQLLQTMKLENEDKEKYFIAITSFVDVDKLNKTSHFGRTLGERMYHELFRRGINVKDFRGQKSMVVNANGEYFISRDNEKLKGDFKNRYILVGTYAKVGKGYNINARIIDNKSGNVVASGSSFYEHKIDDEYEDYPIASRRLRITTDNCAKVGCPNMPKVQEMDLPTKNYTFRR